MAAITGMLPLSSYLMKEWNWWNECDMQWSQSHRLERGISIEHASSFCGSKSEGR
jgi:hypothetical protein